MKKLIALFFFLAAFTGIQAEGELCLISIDADGVETNYAITTVQTVTVDKDAETPDFIVNLKDGRSDRGGRLIKFGNAIPTSAPDEAAAQQEKGVTVYSQGRTIYVYAEEKSDITFYNLAGQQLGESVNALQCKFTTSLAGTYIVVVNGQQTKIQVQ